MKFSLISLTLAVLLGGKPVRSASNGCASFDANGALYLFGSPYGDLNLGDSPTAWTSTNKPTNITALAGRPPFTSANVVCMRNIPTNSIFFLNADPASPSDLHWFDFGKQTWKKITTGGTLPNYSNVRALMDYDTLVIYAFTDGRMIRLGDADKQNVSQNPTHLDWLEASINKQPFSVPTDYASTFSGTWINIYFFGLPGTKAGEIWGWRIHYGEWAPTPFSVGNNFPATSGQATTFQYKDPAIDQSTGGAPNNIAFIPADYSALYIIDGFRNTTSTGPAPPKDSTSPLTRYIASTRYLVQFTPDTGALRFIDYGWKFNSTGTQADSVWKDATVVNGLTKFVGSRVGNATSSGTFTGNGASPTAESTATGSGKSAGGRVAVAAGMLLLGPLLLASA
ncbi:hypothetical protein HDV00_002241 [Rhizophlyctis rosea]|nr:hypothetical protein HDV00_002241 [Rhizophlyctis rosea]